jgi:hypothetical protein
MFRRVENLRMWARNTLHGWFLRPPHGFEKRRREGATMVRKKGNPSPQVAGFKKPSGYYR